MRSSDKILDCCNYRLAIPRSDGVLFNAHEFESLGASFFRLRNMQVHLVPVEVGVVWSTYALVEAECPPWSNSNPVTHDGDLM